MAIHSDYQEGYAALQTQDATGPSVLGLAFDPARPEVELQVIQGTAPGAAESQTPAGSGTPQLPPGGPAGGQGGETGNPTAVPTTPPPGVSPTPTRTPLPTPAPLAPTSVAVQCTVAFTPAPPTAGVTCTGAVSGTYTTTRWTINGLPAPVPPGSTAFNTTFSQDTTAIVEMPRATSPCAAPDQRVVVKFASPDADPDGTPVPDANANATVAPLGHRRR